MIQMSTRQKLFSLSRAASRKHIPIGIILLGLILSLWQAAAQNWAKIYTIGRLDKLACSGDGTKLLVCQHQFNTCVSSNCGLTWTQLTMPNSHVWVSAALSANGAVLAVTSLQGDGPCVYTSTNLGATWIPGDAPTNLNWEFISCSSDGSRMTIGGYTYTIHGNIPAPIYGSTNSGVHWTQIADNGVAHCSGDGTKLFQVDVTGVLKVSANFGGTWMPTLTNANGLLVASHDGLTAYAGVNTNGTNVIYVSHDSGFNWSPIETPAGLDFYPRACSSDGTKLFASGVSGTDNNVYTSTNSGVTWTPNSIPFPAGGIACSTNGAEVYAFFNTGTPDFGFTGYVLTLQGAHLNITPTGTNLVLSWPTNYLASFKLEQNADVVTTNWVEVATPAEIVGNYWQVTNATTVEKKFFRLKSR